MASQIAALTYRPDWQVEGAMEEAILNAYEKSAHPVKGARVELDTKSGT